MGAAPPVPGPRRLLILASAAAFVWGVTEATWFFLVPDILLTFVALAWGPRTGLAAALAAALGAAAGGVALAMLAAARPEAALGLLHAVPFLSGATIARGLAGMDSADWPRAMLQGSLTGIPYKVFAVGAGQQGIALPLFALATIPIRLARFAAATIIVAALGSAMAGAASLSARVALLAAFWILFYGEFWFRWSGAARALLP